MGDEFPGRKRRRRIREKTVFMSSRAQLAARKFSSQPEKEAEKISKILRKEIDSKGTKKH